jgi:hypothetical protein
VFYAPNNALQMRGGTDLYGAVIALNVDIGGNAGIHIDEDAITGIVTQVVTTTTTTSVVGYTATNFSLWRITQGLD